jgi:hypothetical protein
MTDPVKSSLLLEYRCRARGCVLLRVWQTPNGPEFITPRRHLSSKWAPPLDISPVLRGIRAGRLDDWPEASWPRITCGHVVGIVSVHHIRRDLQGATPGRPVKVPWPLDTSSPN